jgi:MFS transporter, DHA2 family, multidrug resistance protein
MRPSQSPPHADGLPPGQRVGALLAILIAVCMATLDTAIINTALPNIADNIGTDSASVIWVVNAYQLAMVAALLPFAALGDRLGHRRIYLAGLLLFAASSLACGLAYSLPTLAGARALQGIGAAAIMSVNAALIRFVFPVARLGRALGINAMVVAIAFTIGPTVASAILWVASWHWLFLVNVPLGLGALALGLRTLPASAVHNHDFDTLAALLCAGLFALLILGLGTFSHGGSWHAAALQWAGAALCAGILLRRQAAHPAPMLAVDLFRRPVFALSALTAICAFTTQGLAFVSLPFLLQSLGHSQVATGFLLTPWPAVVALVALIAGPLSDRYPAGVLAGLGLLVLGIGMACLGLLAGGTGQPGTGDLVWRLILCGAGFGFFQSPNLRAIMGSAPPSRSGGASGIVATARLLGQTCGAALVALCFHLSVAHGPVLALWLGCAFALVGAVASGLRLLIAHDAQLALRI